MAHDDGTASLDRPSLRRRLEAYYSVVAPDLLRTREDVRRRRQPRTTGGGGESRRTARSAAAASSPASAAVSAAATPLPVPLLPWPERFEQIYAKYGGTAEGEIRLAARLAKKYGASVRLQTAGGAGDGVRAVSAAAPATTRSPGGNIGRERLTGPGGAPFSDRPPGRPPNDALDFASESFDPRAALLEATVEQVRRANRGELPAGARDRVERCACLLPPADPLFRPPPARPASSSAAAARRSGGSGPARRPATRRASDAAASYFRALAAPLEAGPFSVLHRAVARRQRVRVVVRYVDGIRGTLTGFLVAFDRHFNLLLRDAEEVYSPRLAPCCRGAGGHRRRPSGLPDAPEAAPMSNADAELLRRRMASVAGASTSAASPGESASGAGAPRFPAWSVRRRHLKQVLVRGDNVVLVYTAGDEDRPPGPRSSSKAARRLPAIPPLSLAAAPTPAPASAAGLGRGQARRDRERRDYASAR
jgi:small nuclear ribonucleoprotein (snRNP)-like protein